VRSATGGEREAEEGRRGRERERERERERDAEVGYLGVQHEMIRA